MTRKQKRRTKSVNILIEDIVNTKLSVNFHTQTKFAKTILRGGSVTQKHAKQDTQRYVSGLNKEVDVEDKTATTCMLLLLVMMDAKLMLTKVFLALDAKIVMKM